VRWIRRSSKVKFSHAFIHGVRKTHTTTNRSVDIFVFVVNGKKNGR
jgi:hypothetical protein